MKAGRTTSLSPIIYTYDAMEIGRRPQRNVTASILTLPLSSYQNNFLKKLVITPSFFLLLRRDGSFAHCGLSAENNPPFLIFFDHFQIQCFMPVKQKGA